MEKLQKFLNDSAVARWSVLVLIASMMFFAYMFVDVMSPLKSLVEQSRSWDSTVFGTYAASEYILNVFGFLIIAGIILDKMGTRFTGLLSASLMDADAKWRERQFQKLSQNGSRARKWPLRWDWKWPSHVSEYLP